MRKNIVFIMIFVFLLSMIGCANEMSNLNETNNNIEIERADKLIVKSFLINEYGDRLILPYSLQGAYSSIVEQRDVEEIIGLECLREKGNVIYSVHKFINENGMSGYCFISYDSIRVIDSWFVIKIPSKFEFEGIKVNKTTIEEIKLLDPATIIFDSDEPSSYHRFSDGTMMEIRYKDLNGVMVVKDYGISEDPSNIVKHLLPIDLSLVK